MKNFRENLLILLESIDQVFVPTANKLFKEKSSLLLFMFHVIFEDENEMHSNIISPQQKMTMDHYRQFIEYYLARGYQFVSPNQVMNGLDPFGKHILITFDDGYVNNQRLLPLMREYKVPALFFIASNFVKYQKAFWWDCVYRQRKKQGASDKKIDEEDRFLKTMTHDAVEHYLRETFGAKSLLPISDLDRPFNPKELKDFSQEEHVFLGNHTKDHAILTYYVGEALRSQIVDAQNDIAEMTGKCPLAFSYPNGNYSDVVVRVVKETGFKMGVTCDLGKNFLPIDGNADQALRIKRFSFSSGCQITRQGPLFCSDFSLFVAAKRLKHSLNQGKR